MTYKSSLKQAAGGIGIASRPDSGRDCHRTGKPHRARNRYCSAPSDIFGHFPRAPNGTPWRISCGLPHPPAHKAVIFRHERTRRDGIDVDCPWCKVVWTARGHMMYSALDPRHRKGSSCAFGYVPHDGPYIDTRGQDHHLFSQPSAAAIGFASDEHAGDIQAQQLCPKPHKDCFAYRCPHLLRPALSSGLWRARQCARCYLGHQLRRLPSSVATSPPEPFGRSCQTQRALDLICDASQASAFGWQSGRVHQQRPALRAAMPRYRCPAGDECDLCPWRGRTRCAGIV